MEMPSSRMTDDSMVITGVGRHQMLVAQYLRMGRPKSFMTVGAFGTMGFSLPSAAGVSLSRTTSWIKKSPDESGKNQGHILGVSFKKRKVKI